MKDKTAQPTQRKCKYCGKPELCGVGKENTPVCEEHYNEYLEKQFAPLKALREAHND